MEWSDGRAHATRTAHLVIQRASAPFQSQERVALQLELVHQKSYLIAGLDKFFMRSTIHRGEAQVID